MNQSNAAIFLYAQQLMRKFEIDCQSAESRLLRATTMRDALRLADVHASSEVRSYPEIRQSRFRLEQAVTRRLEAMLDVQLRKIDGCATSEDMKNLRGRLMTSEWQSLQGTFGVVRGKAESLSAALIHWRAHKEKVSANAPVTDSAILVPGDGLVTDARVVKAVRDVFEPPDDEAESPAEPAPGV